jgi:hypothetical protein
LSHESLFRYIWLGFPRTQAELFGLLRNTHQLVVLPDPTGRFDYLVKRRAQSPKLLAMIRRRKIRFTTDGQWLFSWFCITEDMEIEISHCRDSLEFNGLISELHHRLSDHGLVVDQIEGSEGILRALRRGDYGEGKPRDILGIIFWKTVFLLRGGRGVFILLSAEDDFTILTASAGLTPVSDPNPDRVRTVIIGRETDSVVFKTELLRV